LKSKAEQVDFDSVIPRIESWRPSQPVRSLRCDFQVWENRPKGFGVAFMFLTATSTVKCPPPTSCSAQVMIAHT
jgi:hypothetical protein